MGVEEGSECCFSSVVGAVVVDVEDGGLAVVASELDSCDIVRPWYVDVLPASHF